MPNKKLSEYVVYAKKFNNLFRQKKFSELSEWLDEEHAKWLTSPNVDLQYDIFINLSGYSTISRSTTLQYLNEWLEQMPHDYHAHLLQATYWTEVAPDIRTGKWAREVSSARFLGAELAKDMSISFYLKAAQYTDNYAFISTQLLSLTSYLGEPDCLEEFLTQQPISNYNYQEGVDEETWNTALHYFYKAGGEKLPEIDLTLAAIFPFREPDQDSKIYWLQQALHYRPQDIAVRENYIHFSRPRWGGSHEEISWFLSSALCHDLPMEELNGLYVQKAYDYLLYDYEDFEPDDFEDIQNFKNEFEELLQLPLKRIHRNALVSQYVVFLHHFAKTNNGDKTSWNDQTMQYCYDLLSQITIEDSIFLPYSGLPILRECIDNIKIEDKNQLMPNWLDRYVAWEVEPSGLFIAALSSHFGLYGVPKGKYHEKDLFDKALQLDDSDIYELGMDFLTYISNEAGLYFLNQLAERDNYQAMLMLVDYYDGSLAKPLGKKPKSCIDHIAKELWLNKIKEIEKPKALFQYCESIIDSVGYANMPIEIYDKMKNYLLKALFHTNNDTSLKIEILKQLSTIALFNHNEDDMYFCLDILLRDLWLLDNEEAQEYGAAYYAHAYLYGKGCQKNYYLAKIWLERGLEINPIDDYLNALQESLNESLTSGFFGSFWAKYRMQRSERKISERDKNLAFR